MAEFLTSLWDSVFTPGPTPTLLVATNVTFGVLLALLITLLAATRSVHFAILSFLCAGLWYSINWFAHELAAAKAKEAEAERLRKKRATAVGSSPSTPSSPGDAKAQAARKADVIADSADDEGEDTETEGGLGDSVASLGADVRMKIREAMRGGDGDTNASGKAASTGVATSAGRNAPVPRQRHVEDGDRSGEVSTDSEWEKVDGHR